MSIAGNEASTVVDPTFLALGGGPDHAPGSARAQTNCKETVKRSPERTSCGEETLSTVTGSGAVPPTGTVKMGTPSCRARKASVRTCPRVSLPSLIKSTRREPSAGNVSSASCSAPSRSVAIPSLGSTAWRNRDLIGLRGNGAQTRVPREGDEPQVGSGFLCHQIAQHGLTALYGITGHAGRRIH